MKYFYGASIHGIQDFIFETNKLKEIVGASEIVEEICTKFLDDFLQKHDIRGVKKLIHAAGNIRLLCNDEQAEKIVRNFPKAIYEHTSGVSISQAVVKIDECFNVGSVDELEKKLFIQRNRPLRPAQIGLTAIARNPRTGKPAREREKGQAIDIGTMLKINKSGNQRLARKLSEDNSIKFPYEMEDIVNENSNWLAVIHADGNNLGQIIQRLGQNLDNSSDYEEIYQKFSSSLNDATCKAAKEAFSSIIAEKHKVEQEQDEKINKYWPLRPIILGGDDLTVICRADLAIDFTRRFLEKFEQYTKEGMANIAPTLQNGLTACAGIAFVKESYPFHYAYHLAEELCGHAKKYSKKIDLNHIPASLAFHKVQSSFQADYEDTIRRELTAESAKISFDFGPYGVKKNGGLPGIESLIDCVEELRKKDSPASGLRRWLSELYESHDAANQIISRVEKIAWEKENFSVKVFNKRIKELQADMSLARPYFNGKTPIYHMLALLSLGGEK